MHVNNELGTINDIATIATLAKKKGALVHVDAAQSPGKAELDLANWPIDLLSLSAHKFYGPKGVGALFVRQNPKIRLEPLCYGGGHEMGLRPGTVPTQQVVAMGEAARLVNHQAEQERIRITRLRDHLFDKLTKLNGVHINALHAKRVPHCLNIAFDGVDGEALLYALTDIAVSSGSACTSATLEPSHVLQAIRLPAQLADASIRLSLGRFLDEQDIDFVCEHLRARVQWLRHIAGYGVVTL
jgi:cysteine desulfurase